VTVARKSVARVRWECPTCGAGVLAATKPRRNNIARYCLPCSGKAGVLVERLCPTLERQRKQKVDAKKVRAEKRRLTQTPKPKTTSRSWMRDDKYIYPSVDGLTFNVMEVAERMCASGQWRKLWNKGRIDIMKRLWARTIKHRGGEGEFRGLDGIRIAKSQVNHYTTGRAADWYGVTMTFGESASAASILGTTLHELTHVIHVAHAPTINGVRRPHNFDFNKIMLRMARHFWGYDTSVVDAGYSDGNGYAPTHHLNYWLRERIIARDPRVMGWIGE